MKDRSRQEKIAREFELISRYMDTAIRIPGTKIRLGLDSLLGVLPGAGDTAGGVVSLYLLIRARQYGVPPGTLLKMAGNILLDATVGVIPIVGDVFDVFFKANRRNLALLLRDDPHGVDNTGDVPEDGQEDVEPEVEAESHLQKDADGRQ